MPNWMPSVIIPVLVAIIFAVPGTLAWWRQKNKDTSENNAAIEKMKNEIEASLWKRTQAQIEELQKSLDVERTKRRELEEMVTQYRIGLLILISQLTAAGIEPKWNPPEKTE